MDQKKQSRMIKSYISAIKAVLKENKIHIAEDSYLITSITRACKIHNDRLMIRLPIQKEMLQLLIQNVDSAVETNGSAQPYLQKLFKALFMTAYFGMFRVGELTLSNHNIKAKDVHIGENKDKMLFILHTSKTHGRGDKPQSVKILAKSRGKKSKGIEICPFRILKEYIHVCKGFISETEPFFIYRDWSPVTANSFRGTLRKILTSLDFNELLYNCHSFRIGRSQDLWHMGVPVEVIRKLSRWSEKSSVIYTYLK